jgi:hypothetical protein
MLNGRFLFLFLYLLNIQGRRGLSLSKAVGSAKAVGFDKLNQLRRDLLRCYLFLLQEFYLSILMVSVEKIALK